ncbi:hypothetical protein BDV93DRAFT_516812 [Ceratobasidium sp. AG-I]|nr:hypothetical protein BDV93DRAFT_516812 [Ceratobasidium sp. AG-I]
MLSRDRAYHAEEENKKIQKPVYISTLQMKESPKTTALNDLELVQVWSTVSTGLHIWILIEVHDAQCQNGVYDTSEQYTSLLNQWMHLAPTVLPSSPRLLDTVPMHLDLHAAKAVLSIGRGIATGSSKFAATNTIDRHSVTDRPLFEAALPVFLDHPEGEEIHIQPRSISNSPTLETYMQKMALLGFGRGSNNPLDICVLKKNQ